jgi:hypothetical protein
MGLHGLLQGQLYLLHFTYKVVNIPMLSTGSPHKGTSIFEVSNLTKIQFIPHKTLRHHYRQKPIGAAYGDNWLLSESYEIHKYTLWT